MSTPRLINRQLQIPGGMVFYLPQVKWQARQGSSFDVIVRDLTRVILANPVLAQKHNWPTDQKGIEDWVDLYNATVCQKMGWEKYITPDSGGSSLPKSQAPQHHLESLRRVAGAVKQLVAGARSLGEWIESKEAAVPRATAEARAEVCAKCPRNSPGNFTQWFTVPAAELIKRHVEAAQDRSLETALDDQLGICDACKCPMRLKVHVPIDWIRKRMTPEVKAALDTNCWIPKE